MTFVELAILHSEPLCTTLILINIQIVWEKGQWFKRWCQSRLMIEIVADQIASLLL